MTIYLALLRGVNVGGNGTLNMSELKTELERSGYKNVHTYINSGNVFFTTDETDTLKLADSVRTLIYKKFQLDVAVVVFSRDEWQQIINDAPGWWGRDHEWKHNLLVMIPPYTMTMKEVVTAIGELKPDIETMQAGEGVLYQSMSKALFGRTTTGKLASNPIYKRMTIRNFNTATKLLSLFDK